MGQRVRSRKRLGTFSPRDLAVDSALREFQNQAAASIPCLTVLNGESYNELFSIEFLPCHIHIRSSWLLLQTTGQLCVGTRRELGEDSTAEAMLHAPIHDK